MDARTDFIIAGTIIIVFFLIPLYVYRKSRLKFSRKNSNFKKFILNIEKYLKITYPKIIFNYDIINKTKDEENLKVREVLILEDLILQFFQYKYEFKTQACINKDFLWSTYEENHRPIKGKLPKDWAKRKYLAYIRDKCNCQRCGTKLNLMDAQVSLVKPFSDGGAFNFENLITLCGDCNRVLKKHNDNNIEIKNSIIENNLFRKIK